MVALQLPLIMGTILRVSVYVEEMEVSIQQIISEFLQLQLHVQKLKALKSECPEQLEGCDFFYRTSSFP